MIEWRQVMPEDVPGKWGKLRDLIRSAIPRGDRAYSEADILVQILLGRWQCWAAYEGERIDAILVTEIADFPRLRKCLVRYAAGDGNIFPDTVNQLDEWARKTGCHMIEVYGRRGWVRKIPGWNERYVVLQRKLI